MDFEVCVAGDQKAARHGPWSLPRRWYCRRPRKGLGGAPVVASGKDPIEEREADRAASAAVAGAMTFEQAARRVHEALRPGWRNPKHGDQWINTLRDYVFPKIGQAEGG